MNIFIILLSFSCFDFELKSWDCCGGDFKECVGESAPNMVSFTDSWCYEHSSRYEVHSLYNL